MNEIITFFIIGFFAQIIDGALGMAYGIISMSVLLGIGIPPMVASASIHTAEVITTGVSGLSHALFKNIDYRLFRRLVIPGVIGSIIGSFLLTKIPSNAIKPFIACYLFLMGAIILYKAFREMHWMEKIKNLINKALKREKSSHSLARIIPLGLTGGFCDAVGGGGWGAIVASSLLAQDGEDPHYTIGSTNAVEFMVTLSSSITFFSVIGVSHWRIVLGLLLGGAVAAPLAAIAIRKISPKLVMIFAGTLIILISIYNTVKQFLL